MITPLVFAAIVLGLAVRAQDAYYLPAVVSAIFLAIIILMVLSIPRYVKIGAAGIEIVCVTEVTIIPSNQIASVEWIEKLPLRGSIPIGCMIGFGGYCGYWFSLWSFRPFKMYASQNDRALLIKRKDGCDIIVGGFCAGEIEESDFEKSNAVQ